MQKKEMLKRGGGALGGTSFGSSFGQSISRPSSYNEPQVQPTFDDSVRSSYSRCDIQSNPIKLPQKIFFLKKKFNYKLMNFPI